MGEKPRNRLAELGGKAYDFLTLPDCAIIEIFSAIGLLGRKEKEFRAQHEAGHVLVFLLEGIRIQQVEIQRLRRVTLTQLNRLFGKKMVGGGVNTYPIEDQKLAKLSPDFEPILHLAGLAATQDLNYRRFHDKLVSDGLEKRADEPWKDISIPCSYIRNRFQAIHSLQPTEEKVSEIFYALLNEIGLVFSDEKFVRALAKIRELIKRDKLKDVIINDAILDALYSDGFSLQDLDEMKQKFLAIDIDRIVQNHGPT